MDNDKLIELAERFLRGEATEAEKQQLHTWYDSMGGEEERVFTDWPETAEVVRVRILESLQKQIAGQQPKQVSLPLRRYGFAAAVVLFLLGTGVYFWPLNRIKPPLVQSQLQSLQNDVAPGGNKAILTLANGSTIILDSAHTGELARQGGAAVVKADSGQLVYHAGEGNATDVVYNTLTTPKGGQFELVLPDGTKLWLNAASSVTYPTAFTGNERKVLVTGEAYFEVRKNVSQPFKVAINGKEEIEVLGTSFNVNGYGDERDIKTTLLEGSVRVTGAEAQAAGTVHVGVNTNMSKLSVVLKPGQQAQLVADENANNGGGGGDMKIKMLTNQAQDQAVAWKNGLFDFTGADLETVMRQLGRWYDVEVVYERDIPKIRFVGEMQRELNLSDVLDVLKRTDVHFRIEGRKIIVLP